MTFLSGFENDRATFFVEQTVEQWDPVKEEYVEDGTEYVAEYEDVPVRAEQQGAEHVTEVYGEWPQEVYRLFVDPLDIGNFESGYGENYGLYYGFLDGYQLGIGSNDRVELTGVTDARFSIQPPNLQRLDSAVPEFVQLEVVKIG